MFGSWSVLNKFFVERKGRKAQGRSGEREREGVSEGGREGGRMEGKIKATYFMHSCLGWAVYCRVRRTYPIFRTSEVIPWWC